MQNCRPEQESFSRTSSRHLFLFPQGPWRKLTMPYWPGQEDPSSRRPLRRRRPDNWLTRVRGPVTSPTMMHSGRRMLSLLVTSRTVATRPPWKAPHFGIQIVHRHPPWCSYYWRIMNAWKSYNPEPRPIPYRACNKRLHRLEKNFGSRAVCWISW